MMITPLKMNECLRKKGPFQKGNYIFQPLFFKGHVVLRGSTPMVESIQKHLKNKYKKGFQQTMVHP